jgi:thiamine-phosphate pyrophosphorylase
VSDPLRRLRDARLYLCTDARERQGDLDAFLDAALRGGVDIVQLRQKGLEARQELAYAEVFADAAARHGALWSVNDRADLALAAGADVLHLGQDDLPVPVARRILGPVPLVGLSTHDSAQLAAAVAAEGIDYFCVGPCWPTPTKAGRPAAGLSLVREAARLAPPGTASSADPGAASSATPGAEPTTGAAPRPGTARPGGRPWFAIGGIDAARLEQVLAAGARRVVVVRAITEADDPQAAAAALRSRLAAG